MKATLRILHLEDDNNDAELIASVLETEGLGSDIVRVENGKDYMEALDNGGFDIILADYKLPSYDGMMALDFAKEKYPDIPFIFVSGTLGEESAIGALRRGAIDYVFKNNLKRLVPAIKRAISEAEEIYKRKQVEESLKLSERRLSVSIESGEIGLWELDMVNHTAWRSLRHDSIFGYETLLPEWTYEMFLEHVVTEDRSEVNRKFGEAIAKSTVWDFECRIRRADGAIRWIWVKGNPEFNVRNEPLRMLGVVKDITERKLADEKLYISDGRYRKAQAIGHVGNWEYNLQTTRFWGSDEAKRIYGFDPENDVFSTDEVENCIPERERVHQALLDLIESGKEYNLEFKIHPRNSSEPRIISSIAELQRDEHGNPLSVVGVIHDITEHRQAEDDLKQSFVKTRKALEETVHAISSLVETRDPYTAGHQLRVADIAAAIAAEMGLNADQIEGIHIAGIIHDIGKISIPAEILSTPRKLSNTEFSLIKTHSQSGYDILKEIEFPWPIARIVLEHHERMDGSGYPNGLKGDQTLLESRIISVSDVVEAMASHRPYRAGLGIDAALDEITKNKSILYDPDVVDACLSLFKIKNYKIGDSI